METKIEKQKFYISEFEQEAAWLSFMHKEGWKFVSTTGFKYEFVECEKEQWIYQLDFKEDAVAHEDYIQMFQDYGWEYVTQYNEWFYFRKKKESNEEDLSIFSDRESKIEMCRKIINKNLNRVLPFCYFMSLYLIAICNSSYFKIEGFFGGVLNGIAIGCSIAIVYMFGCYFGQFARLRKIMKNNGGE